MLIIRVHLHVALQEKLYAYVGHYWLIPMKKSAPTFIIKPTHEVSTVDKVRMLLIQISEFLLKIQEECLLSIQLYRPMKARMSEPHTEYVVL